MDWLADDDFARNGANVVDRAGEACRHGAQGLHQLVLARAFANDYREVALGDLFGGMGDFVHGGDEDVEIVLDGIEFALVGVGDLRRQVALADAVHVVGGHVQGTDYRVQGVVDAFHDLAVAAVEVSRVAPGGEFAGDCRLGQHLRFGHQGAQGLHHLDEALAQQVLLALGLDLHGKIAGSDLLRQDRARSLITAVMFAERIRQGAQFILAIEFHADVDIAQRRASARRLAWRAAVRRWRATSSARYPGRTARPLP